MNLNQQFEKIRQSPTVAIFDRVQKLKSSGSRIIPLHVSDPDFETPPAVVDIAKQAMQDGLTHYVPSRGLPDLRTAAAFKMSHDNGLSFDPGTEILVTHGGIHAYFLALQSILNPGDELIVPDPTWATHANMATMLRGQVIRVPAPPENGFIPMIDAWERTITPRTRVIVLNYPCNPTGVYPSREYLAQLHELAARHNLWVVSDEVYENLYYGEKPTSAGAITDAKEHTILVNSLSKTYAMTGWRVGYLAAPEQLIKNAIKAGQNSVTCIAPFVQKAAAFALTDPGVQTAAAEMRSAYARRRDLVLMLANEYQSENVKVVPPKGAFYFFLDFRPMGLPSLEICERILEEAGVGLVPGSAFGNQGEGFVRMSIAASDVDIEAGFSEIIQWAETQ